jgi:hypothetical protein
MLAGDEPSSNNAAVAMQGSTDRDPSPSGSQRAMSVSRSERGESALIEQLAPTLVRMRSLDGVLAPASGCAGGLRLQFGRGARLDCLDLPAHPDRAVVLGRHEACSFRVDGGKAIASRHALLVPRREGEVIVLDLVDLGRRPLPTRLDLPDAGPDRGEHVLMFGEGLLRVRTLDPAARVEVRLHRAQPIIGRDFTLGAEAGFPVDRRADGTRDACVAQLALERGGVRIARWLRQQELGEGLLLRRDPGGETDSELEPGPWVEEDADPTARLFARLTRRLSRAHLLLRAEAGAVVVYDLDSSPGSFWRDQSIHRLALPEQRVRLQLGNPHTGVLMQLTPR